MAMARWLSGVSKVSVPAPVRVASNWLAQP